MRQVVKVMEGKKEVNEIESEDMDACLLQQMKSKDLWSNYSQCSSHGSHPTFDEVRRYHSSMSLSWTNSMVEDFAWQAWKKPQNLAGSRSKSVV
ncbi:hypothetical protein OIU84_002464 [Salix udensis]|uniref:Uncharacterized protein n=1 Tax=Salix udensis TaxID=889485 RepID=A0AAD6P553_9ROSI|nr:hypothetical protein OIU84_002464 [Salix udensis]